MKRVPKSPRSPGIIRSHFWPATRKTARKHASLLHFAVIECYFTLPFRTVGIDSPPGPKIREQARHLIRPSWLWMWACVVTRRALPPSLNVRQLHWIPRYVAILNNSLVADPDRDAKCCYVQFSLASYWHVSLPKGCRLRQLTFAGRGLQLFHCFFTCEAKFCLT